MAINPITGVDEQPIKPPQSLIGAVRPTQTGTTAPPTIPPIQPATPQSLFNAPAPYKPVTVSDRIKSLIDSDIPSLQMARTGAVQGMNERGLPNSSMAQQASDAAWYQAATPIAAEDANAINKAGELNQLQTFELQKMKVDQDFQTNLKSLDREQQTKITNLNNANSVLINSSNGAKDLWSNYQQTVNNIVMSSLEGPNKQDALDKAFVVMRGGMAMYADIEGLNLDQYFKPIPGDPGYSGEKENIGPVGSNPGGGAASVDLAARQAAWDNQAAPLLNLSVSEVINERNNPGLISRIGPRPTA